MLRLVRISSTGTAGIPPEEGPRGPRSAVAAPDTTPAEPIRRGPGLVGGVVPDGLPGGGGWT